MLFVFIGFKFGIDDYSVEGIIFFDLYYFVDVVEIVMEILISWVVVWLSLSVVYFRLREFVFWDFGVYGCIRVIVLLLCIFEIVVCFEDDSFEFLIVKCFEYVYIC